MARAFFMYYPVSYWPLPKLFTPLLASLPTTLFCHCWHPFRERLFFGVDSSRNIFMDWVGRGIFEVVELLTKTDKLRHIIHAKIFRKPTFN